MKGSRRIVPNALTTRYSRYTVGGLTEVNQDFLGWWERYSTESLEPLTEIEHTVTIGEAGCIDLIADKYFGTVSLSWLILQHNAIVDIIEEVVEGAVLRIPDPERVKMGINSLKSTKKS